MALWGTIVNTLTILAGGLLGILLPRIREGIRSTVMQGLGMAVCVLGISMGLKTNNFLILILSLVAGGMIGEWLGIERFLQQTGDWLERKVGGLRKRKAGTVDENGQGDGSIARGFVTATLVYCIGAMSILGAIDSGLRHNHTILYTKAMLDGFTSIIFASTLGVGVLFSAIPVFLYQGSIALASTFITRLISDSMLDKIIVEVSAVGGVLILGIGLNILEIRKINVANLLPSLLIAAVLVPLVPVLTSWYHMFV